MLLGDACGKGHAGRSAGGARAGHARGRCRNRRRTPPGLSPSLNRTLCRRRMAERFVTLFYGVMTARPPVHLLQRRTLPADASNGSPRCAGCSVGGLPPGLFGDAQYDQESLYIDPGDTLVVFSDGIPEASSRNQQFGDARIQQIVTEHRDGTAAAILERLMSERARIYPRRPPARRHGRIRRQIPGLGNGGTMQIIQRQLDDVAVLDLKGAVHCGDGDRELEASINDLTNRGCVRLGDQPERGALTSTPCALGSSSPHR